MGLLARYGEHLKENGWTEQSAENRLRAVRYLAKKLGGEDKLLSAAEEEVTAAAAARVFRRDGGDIRLWCGYIRHFFAFLASIGMREDNPVRKDLHKLFFADAKSTLDARIGWKRSPAPEFERLRERAVAALVRNAGMRPEELQAVEVGWYNAEHRLLMLRPQKRRVHLDETSANAVDEYLDALFVSAPGPVTKKSLLFIHAGYGGALSEQEYWDVIRRNMRQSTG
jgi:site-specific recombinase XerD